MARHHALLAAFALTSCYGDSQLSVGVINPPGGEQIPTAPTLPADPSVEQEAPPLTPGAARMHSLTAAQLHASLEDVLGPLAPTQVVPQELDVPGQLFVSFGTTRIAITNNVLEKLETLALSVADRLFDDPARRVTLLGCTPTSPTDTCVRTWVNTLAPQLWRRPLTAAEVDTLVALSAKVSSQFQDPWQGPRYTLVAMLISPNFLYRFERGEGGQYSSTEMASRLSYAIWNSAPDAELLAAAARNELGTAAQVRAQAQRMIAAPRARESARRHFAEALGYETLDNLVKDHASFPRMTQTLGPSFQTELQRAIDDLVFTRNADLRELFTLEHADVNTELAGLYGVPAPLLKEPSDIAITGGGVNLWGPQDSFHFVYRQLVGDGEIVARVDSMQGTLDWAKAAVMLRENLNDNSRHVISTVSATHGAAFKWRAEPGAATQVKEGFTATSPAWVKLTRTGNTIVGSFSIDGTTWTVMNTMTTTLPSTVWAGVAFTNEDDSRVNTVRFSSVKVTGTGATAWLGKDIGPLRVPGISTFVSPNTWEPMTFKDSRVGIMGFAGVLARASKVSETSPTGRGLFVRERLLCHQLPPAPPDVATELPPTPVGGVEPSMRERLAEHRRNPACAACHAKMDPIGLALENFDGLGEYRALEHGRPIDDSGELDGVKFNGLAGLMTAVKNNRDANRCLVRQIYRDATGRLDAFNEEAAVRAAAEPLLQHGATYFEALVDVVSSDGFRLATQPN